MNCSLVLATCITKVANDLEVCTRTDELCDEFHRDALKCALTPTNGDTMCIVKALAQARLEETREVHPERMCEGASLRSAS